MSGKPLKEVALSRFTFDDGFVTVLEGEKTLKAEYTADLSKAPKQLTLVGLFGGQRPSTHIAYAIDGDTLTLCLNTRPDAEPPTNLTTEEGDGRILLTLQRAKE